MKTIKVKTEDFKPESYVLTIECPYCKKKNYIDSYSNICIDIKEKCVECGKEIHIVTENKI